MKTGNYYKACKCPQCRCVVIVRKIGSVKPSLCKALALADHDKTLHSEKLRFGR